MRTSLQLRQSQQLTLTPQLQQAIKLLQFSSLEINQEASRLLDENPFLERGDDPLPADYTDAAFPATTTTDTPTLEATAPTDAADSAPDGDWGEPTYAAAPNPDDEDDFHSEAAAILPSMREHLLAELGTSTLAERDRRIIALLIEALDDNGYLSQPLEEIHALLPEELELTLDDLETALIQLQHLDEPGIGARNLSECLSLQIRALPPETPGRELALLLVNQHLELLANRDFSRLKKILRCDDTGLRLAHDLVVHLQPKPGAIYEHKTADYIVPDVIVERHAGQWRARLNAEAMPRLRVNQVYANILQQRHEGHSQDMSTQLQEARWFIKNLRQRYETILRVAQAIVERQHKFFEHGEIAMRPLVLREIADSLELHESTISRVTTQKFMYTPRGIFEFKYFFGSGLSTEAGGACSSTAIRALIKQLVAEEDAQRPLSDSRMSEILARQGILVARRTVAKYREGMSIPPVNLRKSL